MRKLRPLGSVRGVSGNRYSYRDTPPAVSRRLTALESRLGVRLLHRTTRRIAVTHEGQLYLSEGKRILEEIGELEGAISGGRATPKGLLRVNATFEFGHLFVAPAISDFVRKFSGVQVQLEVTDHPLNLVEEGFDVGIRFGETSDSRLIARKIVASRRLLCAAPAYLKEFGIPGNPRDLQHHRCIVVRQGEETYGTWHMRAGNRHERIKVRAPLYTNSGESALVWALEGHGLLKRSEWSITPYVRSGQLRLVLEDWQFPSGDIYAVYSERSNLSAKLRAFVDFLTNRFRTGLRRTS